MSGDALELKMYDDAIEESKKEEFFRGYCAGKKVTNAYLKEKARQHANPED